MVSGGKGHVYDADGALLAEQITRSYNTASKIAGNLKAAPIAIALSFWIPIFSFSWDGPSWPNRLKSQIAPELKIQGELTISMELHSSQLPEVLVLDNRKG